MLRFVSPLPCDLPGLVKPNRSISSIRYSSQAHWGTQAPPPRQGSSTRGSEYSKSSVKPPLYRMGSTSFPYPLALWRTCTLLPKDNTKQLSKICCMALRICMYVCMYVCIYIYIFFFIFAGLIWQDPSPFHCLVGLRTKEKKERKLCEKLSIGTYYCYCYYYYHCHCYHLFLQ